MDPEPDKLQFYAQEVVGSPVHSLERIDRPLTVGEKLVVETLFSTVLATVEQVTDRTATARSGSLACYLVWEEAPRHCWVCTCTGNLDAIQKVNFT